jgi:hypothetical protein
MADLMFEVKIQYLKSKTIEKQFLKVVKNYIKIYFNAV